MRRAPTFVAAGLASVAENATTQSRPRRRRRRRHAAESRRVGGRRASPPSATSCSSRAPGSTGRALSTLVIDQTGGDRRSSPNRWRPNSSSPQKSAFAAVKKAAAADPDETGGYGKEWSGLDGVGRCRHPTRRDPSHVGAGPAGARRGRSRVHGRQLVEGGPHHRDRPLHRADRGGRVRGECRHGKIEHDQRDHAVRPSCSSRVVSSRSSTSSRPREGSAGPTPRRSPGPSTPFSSRASRRSP